MESKYTYYHHQNLEKPFHIDYCLVSKEYIPFIRKFSIGEVSEYLSVSDHSPLIFESELNECSAKGKDELGNNKIEDKEISNLLI